MAPFCWIGSVPCSIFWEGAENCGTLIESRGGSSAWRRDLHLFRLAVRSAAQRQVLSSPALALISACYADRRISGRRQQRERGIPGASGLRPKNSLRGLPLKTGVRRPVCRDRRRSLRGLAVCLLCFPERPQNASAASAAARARTPVLPG